MFAFNVYDKNGRLIDTVFYAISERETIKEAVDSVRNSLINHDGYSPYIKVVWPKGQRKTADSFEVRGNYGHGFEMVTAEPTRKLARIRLKEYQQNEPGIAFKIVCVREAK